LSFGGFLGIADKLFAVPWSALKLDTANKRFLLDVEKKSLESAPGFDKDDWPDMADPTWQNTINSYYGTKSYTDTSYTDTKSYSDRTTSGTDKVKDKTGY
jgi:surface antigen